MPNLPTPKIIRSKRRTVGLQVTPTGELIVHAPPFIPKFFIDNFIREKESWISDKLQQVQKRPKVDKRTYTNGEVFLYLGKQLQLRLIDGISITATGTHLHFPRALVFRAQKELENWYIQQAKEVITQRVMHHAKRMNAEYKNIMFSDTKSKWGTCTAENNLQFNWRLVMAPLLVLDYVVIHELVHTTEKNHSRSFWNKVRLYTPAYRQHREWLNQKAHTLVI